MADPHPRPAGPPRVPADLPADDPVAARVAARCPRGGDAVRVPVGWRHIVDALDARLSHLFPDYRVDVAKEKFGLLVYHVDDPHLASHRLAGLLAGDDRDDDTDGGGDYLDDLLRHSLPSSVSRDAAWFRRSEAAAAIDLAWAESARTCVHCGDGDATIRDQHGWIAPRCRRCAA